MITFDIGGTNTRIASSEDGKTLSEPVIYKTPKLFSDGIAEFVKTAKQLSNNQNITAIAGGIAGPMDQKKTMLVKAPNLLDWNYKPLKQILEQELKTKVFLENDTAMWGLGEATYGAGKGKKIVAYITVSTGVGGCRIVNGNIDANSYGFEPGHMIIDPNGPLCGCSGKGHLEALVGGAALEKRFGKKPQDIIDPAVWDNVTKYLAMGLVNIAVLWSPEIIILGGSVMKSISLQKLRDHIATLNTILPEFPTITASTLHDTGGLLGALRYVQQQAS